MRAFFGMPDYKTAVGRVRIAGMLEGISFLLLLGVAMPLRKIYGIHDAVTWAGWGHGFLFICYSLAIFNAWSGGRLSFAKSAMAFVASLIPFGPFVIDRRLEQGSEREPT